MEYRSEFISSQVIVFVLLDTAITTLDLDAIYINLFTRSSADATHSSAGMVVKASPRNPAMLGILGVALLQSARDLLNQRHQCLMFHTS
jgi:hypothetical protein